MSTYWQSSSFRGKYLFEVPPLTLLRKVWVWFRYWLKGSHCRCLIVCRLTSKHFCQHRLTKQQLGEDGNHQIIFTAVPSLTLSDQFWFTNPKWGQFKAVVNSHLEPQGFNCDPDSPEIQQESSNWQVDKLRDSFGPVLWIFPEREDAGFLSMVNSGFFEIQADQKEWQPKGQTCHSHLVNVGLEQVLQKGEMQGTCQWRLWAVGLKLRSGFTTENTWRYKLD